MTKADKNKLTEVRGRLRAGEKEFRAMYRAIEQDSMSQALNHFKAGMEVLAREGIYIDSWLSKEKPVKKAARGAKQSSVA